jgi:hypothetical protein
LSWGQLIDEVCTAVTAYLLAPPTLGQEHPEFP